MDSSGAHHGVGRPLVVAAVAAALLTAFLALVTFGVTATSHPRDLPVVVAVDGMGPARATLELAAGRLAAAPVEELEWRTAGSAVEARQLLDDKEAYGALVLQPGGPAAQVTVLVNGGMNAPGAQFAGFALPQVAQRLGQRLAPAAPGAQADPAVRVETVNPASVAGRTAPVAASALLWIAALVSAALAFVLLRRTALSRGRVLGARLLLAPVAGLTGAAVVAGFLALWDSGLDVGWPVLGFLALTGTAFALLAGAVLSWLGLRGMALLVPLYLLAPAVAGQPAEFLAPAYRALLWSWTPFRFSAEGMRSLLFFDGAPGIGQPLVVLTAIAAGSLLLLLAAPQRAGAARSSARVVPVPPSVHAV